MTISFSQLLSVPMEWCANPKGCYKTVDPGTGESITSSGTTTVPVSTTEDTNPLQDIIDNSIDHLVNASFGKILQFALIIIGIIIAFVIIKKLMVAGAAKVSSMDIKGKAHDAAKRHMAEKKLQYEQQVKEIAEKKAQAALKRLHPKDGDYQDTLNELHEVLEDGQSFYQREIAKQDRIQELSEESLHEDFSAKIEDIDMGAGDLSLKSLNSYSDETKKLFAAVPASKLFEEFNKLDQFTEANYGVQISDFVDLSLPDGKHLDKELKQKMANNILRQASKHAQDRYIDPIEP